MGIYGHNAGIEDAAAAVLLVMRFVQYTIYFRADLEAQFRILDPSCWPGYMGKCHVTTAPLSTA